MTKDNDAGALNQTLQQYQQVAVDQLRTSGRLVIESSCFVSGDESISLATNPGCETFNDDFVALWQPTNTGNVQWAAAIADGVTGSLLAQEASTLACYLGLASICTAGSADSQAAQNPAASVTKVFHRIGDQIESKLEQYQPSDCPSSIWKIAVREGKFLQTTLTMLWATSAGLRVMAVGDGGILYSYTGTASQITTHTFGSGKLQCLGPRSAPVQPEAYLLENWHGVACYTDGFAESVAQRTGLPSMMLDRQQTIASVIKHLNDDFPELVNDNLSAFRVVKG